MQYSTEEVRVRDVGIHLRKKGKGEPVLFLHGAGGVLDWLPFFDQLAAEHALLVPDHPGFGSSDDPQWIRSIPDVAMFYLDLIEQLDLSGIHLVGHSLGGWIAAELAVRNSTRIKSLTLISPAGIRIPDVPVGDNFLWTQEEHARNLFHSQAFAEKMLARVANEEELEIQVKNRYSFAKLAWQPRLFNPDLEKWLHRVRMPARVIWGEEDRILPAAYADLWAEKLPQASAMRIPECGHLPQIEQQERVAEDIKKFLKEVSA
ncbi:MAG: alpha/beta fold hydrolase [Aquisalimonadaceae bacterium]